VFHKIFQDSKLPLWVRPYAIMVTSSNSGLIETIPNVCSLHQLRKNTPGYVTLAEYFKTTYQEGADYRLAQRNFCESLAGYSLVTYLLQIKDRHNGNILIDTEGHIIHIDFGFMFSNSPGSLNFETAPFKLTQEYVDVLDGYGSPMFQYFKVLCIRGYMEVRKYMEKITCLVEMMTLGKKLPCFMSEKVAIDQLRMRFNMNLTEEEVVEVVENLIYTSLDNWRTRHYDRYQYLTNNILY